MALLKSKKFILVNNTGTPTIEDFKLVEEDVSSQLENGEILVSALFISPDPFTRGGGLEGKPLELIETSGGDSDPMIPGSQVGRVISSAHPSFPVDSLVYGFFGWRTLTKYKVPEKERSWKTIYRLPEYFQRLPISYALGAIGMPGITALYAVERILEIPNNTGGTLVVSTATGAVGNMVLQIGKLKGCKTFVFTSTDEKVIWLKTLGAGFIFNYNKIDVETVFKEYVGEEGIDFYFDNIGGSFTYHVMRYMKPHGRIAVCDAISCYTKNDDEKVGGAEANKIKAVPFDYLTIVDKRIRLEGFSVYEMGETEWFQGMEKLAKWIEEGQISNVEETLVEGFDKIPQAFIDRYEAKVIGIQVVKV